MYGANGEKRTKVLIPDSAHGTNPASTAIAGYDVVEVKSLPNGEVVRYGAGPALILSFVLLGAVGCTDESGGDVTPDSTAPPVVPEGQVLVKGVAFTPREVTVPAGKPVTWVFDDGVIHPGAVIALIGIANTLALSIFERTRELGLLRAVGMTRRQLRSAVRWESVIIAVQGTLLGVIVAPILGERKTWRQDPERLRLYTRASWIWVGLFAFRLSLPGLILGCSLPPGRACWPVR